MVCSFHTKKLIQCESGIVRWVSADSSRFVRSFDCRRQSFVFMTAHHEWKTKVSASNSCNRPISSILLSTQLVVESFFCLRLYSIAKYIVILSISVAINCDLEVKLDSDKQRQKQEEDNLQDLPNDVKFKHFGTCSFCDTKERSFAVA